MMKYEVRFKPKYGNIRNRVVKAKNADMASDFIKQRYNVREIISVTKIDRTNYVSNDDINKAMNDVLRKRYPVFIGTLCTLGVALFPMVFAIVRYDQYKYTVSLHEIRPEDFDIDTGYLSSSIILLILSIIILVVGIILTIKWQKKVNIDDD